MLHALQAVSLSPTQPSGVMVSKAGGGGTPIIVGLLPAGGSGTPGRATMATVLSVSR